LRNSRKSLIQNETPTRKPFRPGNDHRQNSSKLVKTRQNSALPSDPHPYHDLPPGPEPRHTSPAAPEKEQN
jgi:hypothetical protein